MNSAVERDDKGWQAEPRKVALLQVCQFAKSTRVEIGGTRKQATITMKKKGRHANMQTNATASEAWTLPAQDAQPCRNGNVHSISYAIPLTSRLPVLRSHRCAEALVCVFLALTFCQVLFAQAGGYLIIRVAGDGTEGSGGDHGPATSAQLNYPCGLAVDSAGNLYIADGFNNRIRKISNGIITTVVGNGTQGFSGDNGPATGAQLSHPYGVAVDSAGNLYIADSLNNRIRKISNGIITTVAGNGTQGFSGDNGLATGAQLYRPNGVAVDSAGNLYIADFGNDCIRKVTNGVITTVVGRGAGAQLNSPTAVAVDSAGKLYIDDFGNNRILKVSNGIITTVAGNGTYGFSGDNGPAASAQLNQNLGVAVDSAGNLYIADSANSRLRKVTNGVITTIAGTGTGGSGGDGGPATSASLDSPCGVAVDSAGNLYVADWDHQIRQLVPSSSTVGCVYSIEQSAQSFNAVGGTNSVSVLASGNSCPWLAGSYDSWITVSGSGNRSGTGVMTYTVSSNSTSAPRNGTIWVAGRTLTVNQAGVSCSSIVSPLSMAISGPGVTGASLTVTSTTPDCQWTAVASVPWILVSGGSTGSGNGTVTFTVGVNSGGARTGTIAVAGQTVYVDQAASGGGASTITVSPSSLDFGTYQVSGANPSPETVNVSGGGQILGFAAQVTSGSNWLSVSLTSGTTPTTGSAALTVTATPGGLVAGSYSGTILVSGTGAATGSTSITVTLTVTAPLPTIKNMTNAASYATGAVCPGELVTIFGTNIGPTAAAFATTDPATGKLATTIGGVQVLFNGVPAPVIYASSTQVSTVVPFEIAPVASPSVWIKSLGQSSNVYRLTSATTAPGLFTQNASGTGPGAILNQDNSLNGPGNPAAKGSVVQVYLTGEGQLSPPVATGTIIAATLPPPQVTPAPALAVGVTLNGQPALYVYAGAAPDLVAGIMQLNVQIPATAPSGALRILVSIGGNTSQSNVTVSVR
jgi:uncharacterized protein (TIGR03437 family)